MDHTVPHPELYGIPYETDDYHGMPYLWIGRSGLRASMVGLGTWKLGLPETGDGSRAGEREAFAILDRAMELGVTFWDTANRYNNAAGNSERVIGRWLKANPDQRRNVVIATKMAGAMDGVTPNHCRLSRGNILDSVYASLARLQTDHIDLLYFHSQEPYTPVEESLTAIEDLVSRDLIRYFGLSKISVAGLRMYQAAERSLSPRCRVIAAQNGFDIVRGATDPDGGGVLNYCADSGVSYIAYAPLARGLLSERYLNPEQARPGDRLVDDGVLERYAAPAAVERVRRLAELAHQWGITVSQLALAYMLTLPGMGPVIPGVTSVAQLEANAQAAHIALGDEQLAAIGAALS
jgi:aryl-alcohol dehydrogenase-like predicted oxidoreductase